MKLINKVMLVIRNSAILEMHKSKYLEGKHNSSFK